MKFSELIKKTKPRGLEVRELSLLPADPEIAGICEDSRKIKPGNLFVARTGAKVVGGKFIEEATSRGAAALVIDETTNHHKKLPFVRVTNTNLACAFLAHEAAGNPTAGMKMIGITGTKGKTTVAYLLRSVLKAAGCKVGMIGTVEIDDGQSVSPADMTTPGSVELVELFQKMKANGVTHCVMEVSSHALHQHRVAGIDFAVAIFTNLTGDHLDYHKNMAEYAEAKKILFTGLSPHAIVLINSRDPYAASMVEKSIAKIIPYRILFKNENMAPMSEGEWGCKILEFTSKGMHLDFLDDGGSRLSMNTPLVGAYNASNILSVVAATASLGVSMSVIRRALEANTGAPGRLHPVTSARRQ